MNIKQNPIHSNMLPPLNPSVVKQTTRFREINTIDYKFDFKLGKKPEKISKKIGKVIGKVCEWRKLCHDSSDKTFLLTKDEAAKKLSIEKNNY